METRPSLLAGVNLLHFLSQLLVCKHTQLVHLPPFVELTPGSVCKEVTWLPHVLFTECMSRLHGTILPGCETGMYCRDHHFGRSEARQKVHIHLLKAKHPAICVKRALPAGLMLGIN